MPAIQQIIGGRFPGAPGQSNSVPALLYQEKIRPPALRPGLGAAPDGPLAKLGLLAILGGNFLPFFLGLEGVDVFFDTWSHLNTSVLHLDRRL